MQITDPMERQIADALDAAGVEFEHERQPECLDFYLPAFDVFIEVKRMHSERIEKQMARAPNVIAAQGYKSVALLATLFRRAAGSVS